MVRPFVKYAGVGLLSAAISAAGTGILGLIYAHYRYIVGYQRGYANGEADTENRLKVLLMNLFDSKGELPKEFNNEAELAVGTIAPDFNLRTLDGSFHSLARYRGKPVVVNIWESWCGPCKAEMPEMDKFARDYDGKVTVLAITGDERHGSPSHVHFSDFVEREGLTSIQVLLDPSNAIKETYKIEAIPTTLVIDAGRRIVATNKGMVDFSPGGPVRKTIDDLLTIGSQR